MTSTTRHFVQWWFNCFFNLMDFYQLAKHGFRYSIWMLGESSFVEEIKTSPFCKVWLRQRKILWSFGEYLLLINCTLLARKNEALRKNSQALICEFLWITSLYHEANWQSLFEASRDILWCENLKAIESI